MRGRGRSGQKSLVPTPVLGGFSCPSLNCRAWEEEQVWGMFTFGFLSLRLPFFVRFLSVVFDCGSLPLWNALYPWWFDTIPAVAS